jgi:1-acyl-sn-glycerol-3-phosphate acyltransferase
MLRIFSVAFWAFVALTLPVFFVGALAVFLATAAFDSRRVALHLYSCFWACFYLYANPLWRTRVDGRQKLPWRGAAVLVANHLSLIDILVLFGLYRPFKWVSKAEVFRVPLLGWNMRLNDYVPITRGSRESVRRMMEHCRRHLARGSPILLFPEGTRSKTGELQSFKDGAFRLSFDTGAPVIPIAVRGTGDSLPKHGVVLRQPMDARVQVLEPLDPRQFGSADALRDAAHEAIAAALGSRPSGPLPCAKAQERG